jgi:hypothetical protein
VSARPPRPAPACPAPPRPAPSQGCLDAEATQPLLRELSPYIDPPTRRLWAATSAVDQFERLLAEFGGPLETARWRETVRPRLDMYRPSDAGSPAGAGAGAGGSTGGHRPAASADRAAASSSGAAATGGGTAASVGAEGGPEAVEQGGEGAGAPTFAVPRALAVMRLSRHNRDTFALGLSLRALTLTAHGSAVRHLAEQAVAVEAYVHRPVWLTGL